MNCPKCKMDYKDNPDSKGFYTSQNEHFGKEYRTFGMQCSNCGFHSTVFNIPVQVPFKRTTRNYSEIDRLVNEFKQKVEDYLNRRENVTKQFVLNFDDTNLSDEDEQI